MRILPTLCVFVLSALVLRAETSTSKPAVDPAFIPPKQIAAEFDKILPKLLEDNNRSYLAIACFNGLCVDCPAITAATQLSGSSDTRKIMLELARKPEILRRFIKGLARSCDKNLPVSPVLLGTRRADLAYSSGDPKIELYGLYIGGGYVEAESGLFLSFHGCVSMCSEKEEADAYNDRLRRLVAVYGPPPGQNGLKERYVKSRTFLDRAPSLKWVHLQSGASAQGSQSVSVGPILLRYAFVHEYGHIHMELQSFLGKEPERVGIQNEEAINLEAAYWSFADTLVLHGPAADAFEFIDPVTCRLMWTWNPELKARYDRRCAATAPSAH